MDWLTGFMRSLKLEIADGVGVGRCCSTQKWEAELG
jgi:hypothetical protein